VLLRSSLQGAASCFPAIIALAVRVTVKFIEQAVVNLSV
jgi:hypothetical protein